MYLPELEAPKDPCSGQTDGSHASRALKIDEAEYHKGTRANKTHTWPGLSGVRLAEATGSKKSTSPAHNWGFPEAGRK